MSKKLGHSGVMILLGLLLYLPAGLCKALGPDYPETKQLMSRVKKAAASRTKTHTKRIEGKDADTAELYSEGQSCGTHIPGHFRFRSGMSHDFCDR